METNEGGPIYPPIRQSIISSVSLSVLRGFQDEIDPRRPVSVFNLFKASTFASFRPTFRPLITIPDPLFELLSVASSSLAVPFSLPDTPFLRSSVPPLGSLEASRDCSTYSVTNCTRKCRGRFELYGVQVRKQKG